MTPCPIAHAKAYPFDIPQNSYVLAEDGQRLPEATLDLKGRHAVIASGSNAAPERLLAKFQDTPDLLRATIPVMRAQLHDFDAVYCTHITSYGAIPATLVHAPGVVAAVFLTWLTDGQLARMHETEAVGVNYDFVKLSGIRLLCERNAGLTTAYAYLSRRGCLNKNGKPVPLAAISAIGRQWAAMSQTEVLEYARAQTAPLETADAFIDQHINSPETRAERTAHLSKNALKHGWSQVAVVR